ncbi:hypothetical protein Daus18300_013941 [Diaporthe australafricana]|uniref:Fungal N-terminal domain-containing protein n=1 Tax=Diaporthe australafricana TaxID=127596 RepID=A0ABR3VXB1_9PEZI
MEVAGLVLGALPLAIQVFEKYRTILSTMKNTKHELDSIIRDLQTEKLILENTCEILLRGIASDFEIEHMIQHPYGDAWKKYDDEVRLRVWKSGRLFQERVEDMMNATTELQGKLALDRRGKAMMKKKQQERLILTWCSELGEHFDQLRIEHGMDMDGIVEKQTLALQMAGLVLQEGGMNYAGAVQWCLENHFSVATLDNEEIARQFYDAVISKLEIDMKLQMAPELS